MSDCIMIYLAAINILTFFTFGIDKWKARRKAWRISEKTLLMLAFFGGSAGALLGMKVFHHKINAGRKPAFVIGIPIMLLLQIAVYVYFRFSS